MMNRGNQKPQPIYGQSQCIGFGMEPQASRTLLKRTVSWLAILILCSLGVLALFLVEPVCYAGAGIIDVEKFANPRWGSSGSLPNQSKNHVLYDRTTADYLAVKTRPSEGTSLCTAQCVLRIYR